MEKNYLKVLELVMQNMPGWYNLTPEELHKFVYDRVLNIEF